MKPVNGGQSALIHMPHHTARNRMAWLSIAAALDKQPGRDLAEHARRIGQAAAARQAQQERKA